ncbi:LytTR family DNA-binding domain-containing protein [Croceitalea rosinachiae]|uniref:LytTR family DNA-binding domain-containing protein n=1 Tax=Croceitalea rosinachiae TaxID=3075596 RepID=A0ABU3A6M5_9FLAO|nr:LytTR family DNA-binding domain-containing protein [Croceitalea sp. F388]MDT0605827.1 LytTR family DNA-binding domain-containing protein [Croceitalea sp. F388]
MGVENIYKVFKNKYPFQKGNRPHFIISVALALWIFVFLWFPEPFELSRFDFYKKLEVIPFYGFFGGFSYYLALYPQRYLYQKYESWNLGFEIIFLATALLIASGFMYVVYYFGIEHYRYAYSYLKYARLIYIPSLIIILPFIIISRILSALIKGKKDAEKDEAKKAEVVIRGSGKYELLKLKKQNIIYVKSDNIYVDIFYEENNEVIQQSLRIKISEIELILPELFKNHRSYLINPKYFRRLRRDNDKVSIELKYNLIVPVSRAKKESVLKQVPFSNKS